MRKFFIIIGINFAVFCTLIVGLELIGQVLYYAKNGRFVFQTPEPGYKVRANDPNYYHYQSLFESHPLLVVRPVKNMQVTDYMSDKKITTTDIHTRWTGSPEDNGQLIKIAVLGGSTTFGTGVTDSDSWPAILQSKLGDKFSVINYGIPCYSTAETIAQMALVVPEIEPDFVIFYEGWNDIVLYHDNTFSPDFYNHAMNVLDCVQVERYKQKSLFDKLNELSAIVRLASKIKSSATENSKDPESCPTFDNPDPRVDTTYERNLQTLKSISEQTAEYTLFVPQVLNYHWFEEKGKSKTFYDCWSKIKNSAMPRLMDRFNLIMKDICSPDDSRCVYVEGVTEVNWSPDDFVDDGHFSKQGGEKFAEIIKREILTKMQNIEE